MPAKKAAKDKEAYYEVEEIVKARVSSKKNRKLQWDYNVKWKGYGSNENTWEPEDSCKQAPESIRTFWRNADLNGRDQHRYNDFSPDEVVGLTPKGKKPAKVTAAAKAKIKEKKNATPSASTSAKRKSASTGARSASARSASAKSKPTRASASRGRRRASARV